MENMIISLMKKLNAKAQKNDDIPVSCIITMNDKIVSSAFNMKNKNKDPLAHAEILAIRKAAKKLKTYNLIDCKLYVTLKPCKMCESVINEARIKKVFYILNSTKEINNTIKYEKMFVKDNYFDIELKNFFNNKR